MDENTILKNDINELKEKHEKSFKENNLLKKKQMNQKKNKGNF